MNSDKLVAFYLIGQFTDKWDKDFFIPQMELLKLTGLYDQLVFIDIHVSGGKQPLPFVPDKIRRITYHSTPLQEENEMLAQVWEFASKNPGYKILVFHSDGVTHIKGIMKERKRAWRSFLEFCTIELWSRCVTLLNFYDCVGPDYIHSAVYGDQAQYRLRAPHYPGMFWWANSSYIKSLDVDFLQQDVPWRRYLAELWIGTGSPKEYTIHRSNVNCYETVINPDYTAIKSTTDNHLIKLQNSILTDRYFGDVF